MVEGKTDNVYETVKKCNDCSRIITGKFIKVRKCGYSECNNCNKHVGRNHKCVIKKLKVKGGNCTSGNDVSCKMNNSLKKND